MTLCTHMWNILQFGPWLNFVKEHVEYNNRYKIINVDYYGKLTHSSEIAYFKVRNFQFCHASYIPVAQQLIFFYFGFYLHH